VPVKRIPVKNFNSKLFNMTNIKKTCFGLLLAGLAFGFSAFKNVQRSKILTYYKVNMPGYPSATDPRGYTYYSSNRCETNGNLCSAQWDIGSNPSPSDGTPLPTTGVTFQTGSIMAGHFE